VANRPRVIIHVAKLVDQNRWSGRQQGSNYRRGCRGFPRRWSDVSPAVLLVKPSQPGMLFVPGSVIDSLASMV